jgi:O-antigen ligase
MTSARPAASAPPRPDYWGATALVAGAMIAVIVVRVHELVPALAVLRPALLGGLGGTLLVWLHTSRRARRGALQDPSFKLVTGYCAWALACSFGALWLAVAAETLQTLVPSILLTLVIMLVPPSERAVEVVTRVFVLAAAFFAVMLLLVGRQGIEGRMAISSTLDANDIAAVMSLTLPFAITAGLRERMHWRVVHWGAAMALAAALVATSSRGGLLALLAGSLVLVLGSPRRKLPLATGAAVLLGIFGWQHATPVFRERMSALFTGQEDYNSTDYTGRKAVWRRARGYMWEHPVFGVGPGNFSVAEGEALTISGKRGKWSNTHNSYLQAGAEMGIPGLAIFSGLLILSARRAGRWWRRKAADPGAHRPELLSAVASFAVSAFFLSHAYFYALFGLVGLVALSDRALQLRSRRRMVPLGGTPPTPPPPAPPRVVWPVTRPMNPERRLDLQAPHRAQ